MLYCIAAVFLLFFSLCMMMIYYIYHSMCVCYLKNLKSIGSREMWLECFTQMSFTQMSISPPSPAGCALHTTSLYTIILVKCEEMLREKEEKKKRFLIS
mmetsp:Transcript_9696/g.10769  ORF Transcript_9696/g.10769 Transcript_9696/m.10769 type:complete len:99 (-) Transcript_9696:293-589(-)